MGSVARPETLVARWTELCHDSSLNDLPYKVELNASGKIELSPRTNRRGRLVACLAYEFQRQLPGGASCISCGVLTRAGVYSPDIVWASAELLARYADAMLFEQAPELCVEVDTPDGEEKLATYLAAGAQ